MTEPIRVVLADDQELIRAGFKVLIDSAPDLTVVGEAANGREAIDLLRSERADVVLMDIRMPELDGLAATREICADDDLVGVRVIVLTTFELDDYVVRAVQAGASGFLGKGVSPDDLLAAIRVVAAGDALLSPAATRALMERLSATANEPGDGRDSAGGLDGSLLAGLTEREKEMTGLAALGLSNDEIAERAYLSPLTVKTHLNRAMMKVGARDRAQLVVLAYQSGLVRPGEELD